MVLAAPPATGAAPAAERGRRGRAGNAGVRALYPSSTGLAFDDTYHVQRSARPLRAPATEDQSEGH